MSKAYLTLPVATPTSSNSVFEVTIQRMNRGYQSQLSSAIVRNQKHHYPIRIKESDFGFSVQCKSVAEYDSLRRAIAATQKISVISPSRGFSRFSYPELGIDYLGLITFVTAGARRFEVAPTLSLQMLTVKDTVNIETTQYSYLDGDWRDIYGDKNSISLGDFEEIAQTNLPNLYNQVDRYNTTKNPTKAGSTNNGDRQAFE